GGALALALMAAVPAVARGNLTFQVFRIERRGKAGTLAEFRADAERRATRIVYDRDGAVGTVTVMQGRTSGTRTLLINGKADASTGADIRTQLMIGHIPFLLRPDARRALCVGLGSGMTAGSMLRHPIERLDIVELSPEVV